MHLYKSDLKSIGHTAYANEHGYLILVLAEMTASIELILLREVLAVTGNRIVMIEDSEDGAEVYTNYLWSDYCNLEV